MFKKNIAFLSLLAVILFLGSCEKDMSPDEPLPDERKQTVFITTNSNRLFGYQASSGIKTWEKSLEGNCVGSPVITDTGLYLMTDLGRLYAWDLRTQEEKFAKINFISVSTNNSLAGKDTMIFVPSDSLYAYHATTGDQLWAAGSNNGPTTTAVTLHDDKLYVGFTDQIRCFDLAGNQLWQASTNDIITTALKPTDNALYFGTADNKMNSVSILNGSNIWTYTTASFVLSSPLVYGGMSISGSDDNNIYCVDHIAGAGQQGLLRWSVPTQERVRSSAAIHIPTNTVLVGCHDFNLYAIDHVSGQVRWRYPTGSLIISSPAIKGDHVYFASYDKYMYCIDVRTGDLVWKTNMDYTADGSPILDDVTREFYNGASGMNDY